MKDRVVIGWAILFVMLLTLACNAFAGRPSSTLPPPPNPTATQPAAEPSPLPGLAPTVTLPSDPTPAPAQGTVRILVDLNIRSGPGVRFDRVGFLLKDERAVVRGQDEASGWWLIECPPAADGDECWVSGGSQFTLLESAE